MGEFQRVYKAKDENLNYEKELTAQLAKLQKTRQKYMDMYADDLISREELNDKIGGMRKEIERLENELKIEVDKDGNVDIYLRLFGDLGLDETVLIRNDETQGHFRTAAPF